MERGELLELAIVGDPGLRAGAVLHGNHEGRTPGALRPARTPSLRLGCRTPRCARCRTAPLRSAAGCGRPNGRPPAPRGARSPAAERSEGVMLGGRARRVLPGSNRIAELPEPSSRVVGVVQIAIGRIGLEDARAGAGRARLSVTVKLMLSNTLSTSARNSMLLLPPIGIFLVSPMSKRVNHGVSSTSALRRAVADLQLNAIGAVRRGEVAALGHAQVAVAGRVGRAHAERPPRVQNHIVGHREDRRLAGLRIGPNLELVEILRLFLGHADQADVAEIGGALLEAAGAVELPAADERVEEAVQVAPEPLVATDGDAPVPLRLDRVTEAGVGRQSTCVRSGIRGTRSRTSSAYW